MALTIYRRHMKACGVHNLDLPARAKRLYTECQCPIWMYGRTHDGLVPRQSTKLFDMAAAEALRASLLEQSKSEDVHGPKIADCIKDYIESRRHELSDKAVGHYELFLGRLQSYCEARTKFFMEDLTVDLLERWKTDGLKGLKDATKATGVNKLRAFLRDALRRGWIEKPLAEQVKAHAAPVEMKSPYTDEEVDRILAGALKLSHGTHGYAAQPATFRLLLELMLEAGMRVGDAIHYDPRATFAEDGIWIYTFAPQKQRKAKKKKQIDAYLSDRLKKAIDNCKWLSTGLPFAFGGKRNNESYLGNEVYERMKSVGLLCDVLDCRPHRLRDTFAVRSLLRGLSLDDVSKLLGHSSVKVTETYYAKWVPGRRKRLTRLVAESFVDAHGDALGNR
jgi:integrase